MKFPTIPPWTVPLQDADLLTIGLNYATVGARIRRCARCQHLFTGPDRLRMCEDCGSVHRKGHRSP
jgi:rRNA maturation endonuclease Nob1